VDYAYFAPRDPVFLQTALDILVELFKHVGLETNHLKTQAMICTPGRIHTQLPTASYHHMRHGYQTSEQWEARRVNCSYCNATLQARSLPCHLATLHWVYQQTVVVEELLDERPSVTLTAEQRPDGKLQCPDNGCLGVLKDGWNMRRHFRDIHPRDKVIIKKEGQGYPLCGYCGMQTYPVVRGHWRTETCSIEVDRRVQREATVTLRCTFTVHGGMYSSKLRCLSIYDNIQAMRQQIRKAWGI